MKIRMSVPYAPGDIWAVTPLIRDFAEQRPGDVLYVDHPFPEITAGNPFAAGPCDSYDMDTVFTFHCDKAEDDRHYYGMDRLSSLVGDFYRFLRERTGISIEQRTSAAEFYPTEFERAYSPVPTDRKICILNAGHKNDVPVKSWGNERFRRVVEALRNRLLFVQVGAKRTGQDFHTRIPGCLDLVGKTTLRELAVLVYHADFVLTGISQLHHAAGMPCYKPRHCITIAGAREPENWANCYKRDGVTWHWIDEKTCTGESAGCWANFCQDCPAMTRITPERIINIMENLI